MVRLEANSQEVQWCHLRDGEVDIHGLIESSSTGRPIIFIDGFEVLDEPERAERILEMNLQRDSWGQLGARVILWCDRATLDEVWRLAPDLLQWRSLIQSLEAADLSVFDPNSYLAWCIDAYRPHGKDRIAIGSSVALAEPQVVDRSDPAADPVSFSNWILGHRCSVVSSGMGNDRDYPAKAWCKTTAQRCLFDSEDLPLPILLGESDLVQLLDGTLQLGANPVERDLWPQIFAEEHVVFVLDGPTMIDGEQLLAAAAVTHRRLIIVTQRDLQVLAEPSVNWPKAWILTSESPQSELPQDVPTQPRESLFNLLLSLFSADDLRRFVHFAYPELTYELPGRTASSADLVFEVISLVERRGLLDETFFRRLIELRARRRSEIEEVAGQFRYLRRFS